MTQPDLGKTALRGYISPKKRLQRDKYLLLLLLPGFIYFIIFRYIPMFGLLIAFKDYKVSKGIFGSSWNNFRHFKSFLGDPMFWRLFRNTFLLGLYSLLWGFPIPIIFAILLNEVQNNKFKRTIQTISYLPHFISTVIIVGMVLSFLSPTSGIINRFRILLNKESIHFMAESQYFRTIYISVGIWQNMGWSAIIYLAAMSNINPELYESCRIDGGNRFEQAIYVTIPCIAPTIIVLFILQIGGILSTNFEKVLLLQNPSIYETADVIDTFVYRRGIVGADFGYATAVSITKSIISITLISLTNYLSKHVTEVGLW